VGLFTGLLGLPLAPAIAVVRLARLLQRRAEEQLYDPVLIRRRLDDIAEALEAGEISEQQAAEQEEELLGRLLHAPER
jgi:hypothetical protein